MKIEVKNDAMLGKTNNTTLHIELMKLQQENKQLVANWEHIKHYINFWYEKFNEHSNYTMASEYKCILNKIKELEEGVKDE